MCAQGLFNTDLFAFHFSGIEDYELLEVLSEIDALGDDAPMNGTTGACTDTLCIETMIMLAWTLWSWTCLSIHLPQECFINAMAPSTTW